jgi:two-component system, chemotaxis family, protein-glutamate methylesterase/glutaminase
LTRGRIRVLVADDSAFARKVLREVLAADPDIDVVAIARDGLDALEKIAEHKPDVVTLDLLMPNLDGLGVLRALEGKPGPRVVVVSTAEEGGDLAIQALQAGAVDLVHKPTSLATERLYELSQELVTKVKVAAEARARMEPEAIEPAAPLEGPIVRFPSEVERPRVLVVGASTGGPQALTHLLRALPGTFPVPVALVLHMPIGYTAALAARLDGTSALRVVEASDGLVVHAGVVIVARAGVHLRLDRKASAVRTRLTPSPLDTPHRPAVDVLFESAAAAYGSAALGLVLTGMGEDGLRGARALVAAGSKVITEAESSCVVYGMPRAIAEEGLSAASLPLQDIPAALLGIFAV